MIEPTYTLADITAVATQLEQHADAGFRELDICNPYWLGSVWHCRTHAAYFEDGEACPR